MLKYSVTALFLFFSVQISAQTGQIDSMKTLLSQTEDSAKIDILTDLGFQLRNIDPQKSLEYELHALELARYFNPKNPKISVILNYIGVAYRKLNNYATALVYYNQTIQFLEENGGNDERYGYTYQSIGEIYEYQKNFKQGIDYAERAIGYFEKIKNDRGIAYCYVTIGQCYEGLNNQASALDYFMRSLKIRENSGDKAGIAASSYRVGRILIEQRNYKEAKLYCQKALSISQEINDKKSYSQSLYNLAKIEYHTGQAANSIKTGLASLKVARELNSIDLIQKNSYLLANAYLDQKNIVEGQYYQKMAFAYSDSVFNEETDKTIALLQIERSEAENKALRNEHELNDTILKNQEKTITLQYYLGAAILVSLLVMFFFILNQNRQKKERQAINEILIQKNREINNFNEDLNSKMKLIVSQKEELELTALHLQENNSLKDKLFSIISHDLRGPMGSLKGMMELLAEESISKDEFQNLSGEVKASVDSMMHTIENLLQWANSQMKGVKTNPISIKLKIIIYEEMNLLHNAIINKNLTIHLNIDDSHYLFVDYHQTKLVVRNLMSNAIKFTPFGGSITISSARENDKIHVSVSDTGTGITSEDLEKLFKPTLHFTKYGTANEKGTGLGLLICKEFVEKNNGTRKVESEEGKGSTFTISLPVAEKA